MNVLVAGANGYLGRHVVKRFLGAGFRVYRYQRDREGGTPVPCDPSHEAVESGFDVVLNCARPHWSQYEPEQIARIERNLLKTLGQLAKPKAVKIHTSGVWLFGHADQAELSRFELKPFKSVHRDADTINQALNQKWHIVYCPSLIYGGGHCQLRRILEERSDKGLDVAVPSTGYNQFVHVEDVAQFYVDLVARQDIVGQQHFIAEQKGFSPLALAEELYGCGAIPCINRYSWEEYQSKFSPSAVDIEKLNLDLPLSPYFVANHEISDYISDCIEF